MEQDLWAALQNLLLDPYGTPVKLATRSYRQNASDYRKSHIIRALSVLSLYSCCRFAMACRPFLNLSWLRFKAD